MTDAVCIRPAHRDDLDDITAIYADAVKSLPVTWDTVVPTLDAMTEKYEQRTASGYPWLVAEIPSHAGGRAAIAGYAAGGPFHPQDGWRFTIENSIYVARGHRRLGIGRLLLTALIEEATQKGFRQMLAGVSLPGGEASIAFHEAMGFEKAGVFPATGWKMGQWLTAVYLQRPLGEGAAAPPPDPTAG